MTVSRARAGGPAMKPALRASSSGETSRSLPRSHPGSVPACRRTCTTSATVLPVSPHREIAYIGAFDPRGRCLVPPLRG
jgi:hypothetical protein